ncbi:MFS transporter [Cellulomonas carbonis]|uniref:Nitrate/nitrite transporter integral membrane protein n=1 Tax=Cellulomonas carbonis T26 TaxID=947969 RepID=A0A0A0BM74_9CELL|nr:nitrate/nitrite transporter [Cellulomonas carbonis]KGM09010.1 nitrate/nitrite transporter integral membrane protein [Cellulomonas carbonis T26]GGB92527.1 MFS transporter [Cellulomonas carbonis]
MSRTAEVITPPPADDGTSGPRTRVLALSTTGFTLMFAVWLMFGVLGIPIRDEFGLSDVELSWLTATAILNGALWRLPAGLLADRYGGRRVFITMLVATAVPTFLVSQASSFAMLLVFAFFAGFAGNAFSVGIAWNSAWFPRARQGFALGVFGAGNVGASVTKLIGPALIAAVPSLTVLGLTFDGWRFVPLLYTGLLLAMAVAVWVGTPRQDRTPGRGRPLRSMLAPLRDVRVWRFSLYYVVVFGAYVALSAWLPKYYVDVFDVPLSTAALLTALFIFPASLLRPLGGHLADRFGARVVMYGTFATMLVATGVLMMPYGYIVLRVSPEVEPSGVREVLPYELTVVTFTLLVLVVGVAMGIGKAAVFKHIPEYFPADVGAVGGLVGTLGALGGFFLPPMFAYLQAWTGMAQSTFFLLFVLTAVSAVWMHVTIHRMQGKRSPEVRKEIDEPQPAEADVTAARA